MEQAVLAVIWAISSSNTRVLLDNSNAHGNMNVVDWIVLLGAIAFIVIYGVYKTRNQNNLQSYFRGESEEKVKWWTIGLSVMATQASAITFMSTPGQAFEDGMRFIQFYFGLPLAMIVICVFFLPRYIKLKVYTAYEFLESRFDVKTRTLAALLFLIQRGLAAGITIYAPAIILSTILKWPLEPMVIGIGVLVIVYTVSGGTRAVSITQKQQMVVIFVGMITAFTLTLNMLPDNLGFLNGLKVAGALGKMNIVDTSLDMSNRYNIWSGLTGGFFLALSYFGTDQSQVARYISGSSLTESRLGLIFNGLVKIPMQFFILLCGIMVFLFYQYNSAPSFFNQTTYEQTVEKSVDGKLRALEFEYLETEKDKHTKMIALADAVESGNDERIKDAAHFARQSLAKEQEVRKEIKETIVAINPDAETKDSDYVFLTFVLNHLPHGIIGLLLAVIFSAAMSSTSSEINALSSTTMVDLYKRFTARELTDNQQVVFSKGLTVAWGILAIIFALGASLFDNLIEAVNILGSLFYGTILGIFLVAFLLKWVKGTAVFIAALIAEALVITLFVTSEIGFLWFNVIGCAAVMLIAVLLQAIGGGKES